MSLPLAASTRTLWYLTRGAGAATLVLLTLSVALGIVNTMRWSAPPHWPRFVIDALHRNASLLALPLVAVHVLTAVVDSFAPIALTDTVIPFVSAYRPIWLGFGAIAFDLLIAVTLTSLLRRQIGFRGWRIVHWFAYVSWPLALIHGLGAGTDTKLSWMLALAAACIVVVLAALFWRIWVGWPDHRRARASALGLTAVAPLALVAWLASGPLAAGWARRAGTPSSLVLAAGGRAPVGPARRRPTGARDPQAPFDAQLAGTVSETQSGSLATVHIDTRLSGGASGTLNTTIMGPADSSGGVSLSESAVTLGSPSNPSLYHGRITSLAGSTFHARLSDARGHTVDLSVALQLDTGSGTASGSVVARRAGTASR